MAPTPRTTEPRVAFMEKREPPIPSELDEELLLAKKLTKQSTDYFFLTRFFPKETRSLLFSLYAYAYVPREIVRTTTDPSHARTLLREWRIKWYEAIENGTSDDPILRLQSHIWRTYHIPFSYADHFIDAMITDTEKSHYGDIRELAEYLYGSGGVLCLALVHSMGYKDNPLPTIEKLAYAIQLTLILRTIGETYTKHHRLYIPEQDLRRFHVVEETLQKKIFTVETHQLIRFEIARIRKLFSEGELAIASIPKKQQRGARVCVHRYKQMLKSIESDHRLIYAEEPRLTWWNKISLFLYSFTV